MTTRSRARSVAISLALGAGLAASAYPGCVANAWSRYGRAPTVAPRTSDALLDRFMPRYEVAERHQVRVAATAPRTLATAARLDLFEQPSVRALLRAREAALGAPPDRRPRPRGLLAQMRAMGWGVLAEVPGREIVVGAVTRPWEPTVIFRAVSPAAFAAFREPGYVKIVWTLRADPLANGGSLFRTETRAIATDAAARSRFRQYWSRTSPGIGMIRTLALRQLKEEAERRR